MMRISVVIITKDRPKDLEDCLCSLGKQSTPLDELIVINNGSLLYSRQENKKIHQVMKRYQLQGKVRSFHGFGLPKVRNYGIQLASYNWVACVDDDCVADPGWFAYLKTSIKKTPKLAAVMGRTTNYFPENIWSSLGYFFDLAWKEKAIGRGKILDLEILDSKNIAYNKKFLTQYQVAFDTTLASQKENELGASEDSDLGMQIHQKKGKVKYLPQMHVRHKYPGTLSSYYAKILPLTRSHQKYEKKWQKYRKANSLEKPYQFLSSLVSFFQQSPLSLLHKTTFLFFLVLTLILKKMYKNYLLLRDTHDKTTAWAH
jgi:glycosyltransferase involved in cell wall biosynthesis